MYCMDWYWNRKCWYSLTFYKRVFVKISLKSDQSKLNKHPYYVFIWRRKTNERLITTIFLFTCLNKNAADVLWMTHGLFNINHNLETNNKMNQQVKKSFEWTCVHMCENCSWKCKHYTQKTKVFYRYAIWV